jgi:hypothetical protein
MKQLSTSNYKEGIESLNIFMDMLEDALMFTMPGVELRRESSFFWLGYQIEKYPGLKESQYYCLIHLDAPNNIEFYEYYEMSHKPFLKSLNLIEKGFYTLTYEIQEQILKDFIQKVSEEAIAWNSSPKRRSTVPERLW